MQKIGLGVLLDRLEDHHAGVVDDDVEPAEAGDRGIDGGRDLGLGGDVAAQREDVACTAFAQGVGGRMGAGLVVVGQHEPRPFGGEAARRRCADAAGRAGDDHDLVLKAHVRAGQWPLSCVDGAVAGASGDGSPAWCERSHIADSLSLGG